MHLPTARINGNRRMWCYSAQRYTPYSALLPAIQHDTFLFGTYLFFPRA